MSIMVSIKVIIMVSIKVSIMVSIKVRQNINKMKWMNHISALRDFFFIFEQSCSKLLKLVKMTFY